MAINRPPQRRDLRELTADRRVGTFDRLLAGVTSVLCHLLILTALVIGRREMPVPPEPVPRTVALVELEPPPLPEVQAAVAPELTPSIPSPAPPAPRKARARPAKRPPEVKPLPAAPGPQTVMAEVSDAQLAGAANAGSGSGGGGGAGCDMARRLQAALRRDPLVQAAVAQARSPSGRAMMVWNGDWIQSRGEEGKGLAAVRQAMIWEIGFAPEPCRNERMRGLVLFTMAGSAGAARLVVGSGQWRWSDMLNAR